MTEGSGTGSGRNHGRRRRRSSPQQNQRQSSQPRSANANDGRADTSSVPNEKRRRSRKRNKSSNPGQIANNRVLNVEDAPSPGALRHFKGELNAFELFCAYHLGINEFGNPYEPTYELVARRFNTDTTEIREALKLYHLDNGQIAASRFDLRLAKMDIEVAPPGIDRVELAKTIYEELLDAGCGHAKRTDQGAHEQ